MFYNSEHWTVQSPAFIAFYEEFHLKVNSFSDTLAYFCGKSQERWKINKILTEQLSILDKTTWALKVFSMKGTCEDSFTWFHTQLDTSNSVHRAQEGIYKQRISQLVVHTK